MRVFPRFIGAVYTSLALVMMIFAVVDNQEPKPLDRFLQPDARMGEANHHSPQQLHARTQR
ncbi:MAG: hypothetical protein ACKO6N_10630 [Myxococcota bacterium]